MTAHTFYIVDVFAQEKYTGNQLAVFRNARDISEKEMQRIAKETNFSETTFILSDEPRDEGYDVRIFTPAAEVPFAGHPTLGTAYIIAHEIIGDSSANVNLNLKVGQIPVTSADDGVLWMTQNPPSFGATHNPAAVAEVLDLNESDIDTRFSIQEVSTGLWFVIVPLKTQEAIKRAETCKKKYFERFPDGHEDGVLVFCPETYDPQNDLNVRVFVPLYGIDEDPATGSGNGTLAAYLVKHRYFGTSHIDIRVEQGYEIDRPSLLRLRAEEDQKEIHVRVGGNVVPIAQGQWLC